jgi:hypothetical protein
MTTPAAAALLNLLGYVTGSALYAMLLVMVFTQSRATWAGKTEKRSDWPDRLPLLTALLGLAWNVGALAVVALQGFAVGRWRILLSLLPLVSATTFTALGFLPAVVVHSLLRQRDGLKARPAALLMTIIAYTLGAAAGVLHFHQAVVYHFAPSHWALHTLTVGFLCLIVALLIYTHRRPQPLGQIGWSGAGWALALAVFAVSALHLSHHEGREFSWWVELIGHHASLPLALAILYQDYRFALADIFLKRALSLVLLVSLAFGLYLTIAAPLLGQPDTRAEHSALAVGLLLGLWVATALVYPLLRRMVNRFVDAIVLHRANYETVRAEIAGGLAAQESPENVLDEVCLRLSEALTAREVRWTLVEGDEASGNDRSPSGPLLPQLQLIEQRKHSRPFPIHKAKATTPKVAAVAAPGEWRHEQQTLAMILVPTTDSPQYRLLIGELSGGRRLLSDDLALIEAAAVMAARRIDAVRVVHERCVRDLHEEEIHKLATQAELRALRAQINPHFLFNALTTIGYLIQAAPDRALETLMRLTALLRGVLRHSDGEFSTLGEEIELIEAYLEIERARFEDRLRVMIDVPDALRGIRIPALLIQPLVENAIKHGISPQRAGGEVVILARNSRGASQAFTNTLGQTFGDDTLQIWVRDTGAGANELSLEHGRKRGVGLANVEQRIRRHFGEAGAFSIRSAPGLGTTVELGLPINSASAAANAASAAAKSNGSIGARRRQS